MEQFGDTEHLPVFPRTSIIFEKSGFKFSCCLSIEPTGRVKLSLSFIVCQAKSGALRSSAVNCPPTQSVGSSKHTRVSISFEAERSAPKADVVPPTINN